MTPVKHNRSAHAHERASTTQQRVEQPSHLLSISGTKTWVRPKNFGRNPDGTGPGRKKGQPTKVTREIRLAIQARGKELVDRLFALAFSRDKHVSHAACKTLLLYGYGRPTIHVEVDGNMTRTYVAELPKDVSHEQWLEKVRSTCGSIVDVAAASTAAADDGAMPIP